MRPDAIVDGATIGHRNPKMTTTDNASPAHVAHSELIDAPIDELWQLLSDFNNVAMWHPDVVLSRIESGIGTQAGAVRAIRLRDGTPVRERLLAISGADHSYTYSVIEAPLPLRNHRSTVKLESLGNAKTRVTWTADFDALGVEPGELAAIVKSSVMVPGITGLRERVKHQSY
jgi:Polyketide cyclase / dehydrase and lipid transport